MAASPTLLAGFDGLRRAVADARSTPLRRETVGLAVGVAVDNAYGAAFHSMVLALGADDADITAMRRPTSPRTRGAPRSTPWPGAVVLDRGAVKGWTSCGGPGTRG